MELTEDQLVMLRLPNNPNTTERQRHYNTWFKVLFVDTDNTFIGQVEKIDRMDFELYKVGETVRLDVDKIQHVFKQGEEFCYSDGITICNCPALCRNK